MENLTSFFAEYGPVLTFIALAGIIILGILKYCNLFSKIAETYRHYIYISISVGLSLVGSAIYLLVIGQFEINCFLALAGTILLLNQTFYNIYKVTPLKTLCVKALDVIKNWLIQNKAEVNDDKIDKNT